MYTLVSRYLHTLYTCIHKLEGHIRALWHAHIPMSTTGTGISIHVYMCTHIQQYAVSSIQNASTYQSSCTYDRATGSCTSTCTLSNLSIYCCIFNTDSALEVARQPPGRVSAPAGCARPIALPLGCRPKRANARPVALPNLRRRSRCNSVPKDSCVLMWGSGRKERTGGWAFEELGGRAEGRGRGTCMIRQTGTAHIAATAACAASRPRCLHSAGPSPSRCACASARW